MNFTKEYIKECDCREIQGLRPILKMFDFVYSKNWKLCNVYFHHITATEGEGYQIYQYFGEDLYPLSKFQTRQELICLPTSDQLDDEIVKICKKSDDIDSFIGYCTWYDINSGYFQAYIETAGSDYFFEEINPLIAKIKLLKALLKEQS